MTSAKDIEKYKSKSVSWLLEKTKEHFNRFIRNRDTDENGNGYCISSGQPLKVPSANAHAGHFYAAGNYPSMRFNEDNVHLQGKSDNYFNGANLLEYRKNLIKKIGIERVEELDRLSELDKRSNFKWDRIELIGLMIHYRNASKG